MCGEDRLHFARDTAPSSRTANGAPAFLAGIHFAHWPSTACRKMDSRGDTVTHPTPVMLAVVSVAEVYP